MPTYRFRAAYTKNGQGYTPSSAPTVTIVDTSNNILVSAAATTALSNLTGVYVYSHTNATPVDCIAKFTTTDVTADAMDVYDYTPNVIADYIDASIAAVKAKTDNLPTDPADQSAVEAAITAATGTLMTAAAYTEPGSGRSESCPPAFAKS